MIFSPFDAWILDTMWSLMLSFMPYTFSLSLQFIVSLQFVVSTFVLTHLVIVFFDKQFQWNDLLPNKLVEHIPDYYRSPSTVLKALFSGALIAILPSCDWLKSDGRVHLLILLLALPQLVRLKGRQNQQLRVVMGPLTPLLVVFNVLKLPLDPGAYLMALTSFLAFVVLRPDNVAVLDLLLQNLPRCWVHGIKQSRRRRLHGCLAAANAAVALAMVLQQGLSSDHSWPLHVVRYASTR